ncbi:MAG: glycosyltransferase [Nanopusillaceae archaeon]
MNVNVFVDVRWEGTGVYVFSESFLESVLFSKDKLEKKFGENININVYFATFDNNSVKYYKADIKKLLDFINRRNILGFHDYLKSRRYKEDSKEVDIDEIIKETKGKPKIFSNFGLLAFNNTINNKLEDIIDKYTVGHFHGDIIGPIILELVKLRNEGKIKLNEKENEKLNYLHYKILRSSIVDEGLVKESLDFIEYLYRNNEDFKNNFGWIRDIEIAQYKNLLETIGKKDAISIFPTYALYKDIDSLNRILNNGKTLRRFYADFGEPIIMVSIDKIYKNEINKVKEFYKDLYGNNNEYNLNGKIKYWLVYNGRTSEERGFKSILYIYEKLLESGENVGLIIISSNLQEGSEEFNKLKNIVEKYKKRSVIHLYGDSLLNSLHKNPIYYISLLRVLGELKSSVYINPAYRESYGLAMLEALILGEIPVVYRDVDGISSLKEIGYLKYELGGISDQELYEIAKEIIKGIKEGKYDKYINKRIIKKLREETDPEEVSEKYQDIIEDIIYEEKQEN